MKSPKPLLLDPTSPDPSKTRFGEPAKFLPVAFVLASISCLWSIYVFWHCLPLMSVSHTFWLGLSELVIVNFLTILLLTCYVRCVLQHPGTIPSSELSGIDTWECLPQDGGKLKEISFDAPSSIAGIQEKKRSGDRRSCKWCGKYKPDRAHHCRVCRTCILKMDHHCPWVYNCIGFKNYKYFFLLIMYSTICLHFILWTMLPSLTRAVHEGGQNPFIDVFILLFAETFAALLALFLSAFFVFHTWLMLQAMTTIEFCEKSKKGVHSKGNQYDRGLLGNIRASLGDDMLLWFLPCSPPSGDGLSFLSEETPLRLTSGDVETPMEAEAKLKQRLDVEEHGPAESVLMSPEKA